jgi:putative Ca2+/H+ antiporter (TMEM165/GDT1 family)
MIRKKNIFIYTFILIFMAELGDKTQIATFSLSAQSGKAVSVIIGAASALITSSLLAVLLGNKLASVLPQRVLNVISALLFIGTGVFMAVRALVS